MWRGSRCSAPGSLPWCRSRSAPRATRVSAPPGAILARVVTLSYVGGILGPVAIGWTAEHVGLRAALWLPAGLILLIVALAGRVAPAAGGSAPSRLDATAPG